MNRKQLILMWIGIAVFVLVGANTKTRFGFDPIIVDYSKLATRLLSTVIVTAGLIYTLRDEKGRRDKDD